MNHTEDVAVNSLVEAFVKFCVAVHQSLLPRLSPTVCALEPLYEPEKVSVPLVAERFARFRPARRRRWWSW